MRLIKFPSIEQYRNVVRNVTNKVRFVTKNEDGEPYFDKSIKLPTLSFEGTVKLHGTNAGVGITSKGELWAQSRENIITPDKDNAGFASFAYDNSDVFQRIASFARNKWDTVIYGEWCGGNIQKGVAINGLPKMFVIFAIAVVDEDGVSTFMTRYGVEQAIADYKNDHIRSIYDFPCYSIDIDFECPEMAQNELNKITSDVETECPVGKSFGISGVGEGVVWRCVSNGYYDPSFWFKVKGAKHANSKVKTLATVDVEKINNIKMLSEKLANDERLEQIYQTIFNTLNGGGADIKEMGHFIKSVMADILKEEADTIIESGFTGKDISKSVSIICRDFIMSKLSL